MEKIPKLRRNRSNDSLSSNNSGSSVSSSDSGSSRGEGHNYAKSCWPFSCLGSTPQPSVDNNRDAEHSTHSSKSSKSSNSTLTAENKRIHDRLAVNKKVNVSIQLKHMSSTGVETGSLKGEQHSPSGGGLGKMTRSHSSAQSLSELSAGSHSNDEAEKKEDDYKGNSILSRSLPSQEKDPSQSFEQSLQVQQVQTEASSHLLGDNDMEDEGYFMGCDIEDSSSQGSGHDDYDLDSSRRG